MQAHEQLSVVFERRGELAKALASARAAGEIRESLAESRIQERMRVLELHAEAEKAAREVELERERRAATETALAEQQRLREQYESLARTDPLTGLSNRRHLTEVLGHELSYVKRRYRPLTLLLVDVDHFKKVNDAHGHDVGDAVLVEVAKRLVEGVRDQDWVCRWGGEEFCIALVDTTEAQGSIVAGRLLASIRERPIVTPRDTIRVSASVGLTALRGQAEPLDVLLQRADAALYAAKRAGRDRFLAAP
jgi:diguanylate cyclase (GGDEF)-like protein